MKFSEAWLREWVNPDLSRDDLISQLTMAGLEVEGYEPVAGEFEGVVIGRIESCDKHPDADKLNVCTVTDGAESFQVVCGAPNARPGLITAFAKVGAVLPDNFKIKKAKLRGVESQGMLCSAKELGLGDDDSGIMDLPESLEVGQDLAAALATDDAIIDLDLTPNRGDCLSLKGLAREVGVLNNIEVTVPEIAPVTAVTDAQFPVELAAPQGCPRYLGRVITGIDLGHETPLWMVEKLRRCGLRSIDPVVDVTNFVLIELGQPMHAFDLNQLSEGIVVRMAQASESLTLLDGTQVSLDTDTLLITDGNGPVAIAGVMGGERSGVQADTKDVFLECAFFAPLAVAGTARRYGLQTDASHRYERGVDHELQFAAIERATQLLIDIVGGEPGPVVESVSAEALPQANEVKLRHARLDRLMGVDVDPETVDDAFVRLDFEVISREQEEGGITWTIRAPSHRFDIAIEADLVEEICRIYGYNNVEAKQPTTDLGLRDVNLEEHPEASLKAHLTGLGFQEVITYSFVEPGLQDLLNPRSEPVALENPMSSEQAVMRTNLLPGLVSTALANKSRQQDRVKIFEVGQVFRQEGAGLLQPVMLGGLLWGQREAEAWHRQAETADFYDAKGVVDGLIEWAGTPDVSFVRSENDVLHPGQAADLLIGGVKAGWLGRLHPEIESRLELEGCYLFEIDAAAILFKHRRVYGGLSRFPSVRRDLAIVVDKKIDAQQVEGCVRTALGEILVDFRLFDVYEGKGIDSNEKSLALGLTFQSQTATLTDEEINDLADSALSSLEREVNARLR